MQLGRGGQRRSITTALAGLAAVLILAEPGRSACRPDTVELRGMWGAARFRVEVADTAPERAQGLMYRETLARGAGMLFVYPFAQRVSFWMRNTLIPLDMIFVDARGVVRHVHENAVPLDETPIPGGGGDIQYVLEINGGLARQIGIAPGSAMRHPAITGPDVAWACSG
ncbi:MAG: DUF192 domain-containing protein [Pseudomonadota bacterium]